MSLKSLFKKIFIKLQAFLEVLKNTFLLVFSWFFGLAVSLFFVFIFVSLYVIASVKKSYLKLERKMLRAINKRSKKNKPAQLSLTNQDSGAKII